MEAAHLEVPAIEAHLIEVLRAVNAAAGALDAGVVAFDRQAVRVFKAIVRIDEVADLPVRHACVRVIREASAPIKLTNAALSCMDARI